MRLLRRLGELLAMNRKNRAAQPGRVSAFDARLPGEPAAYRPERQSRLSRLRRLPGVGEQRRGDGGDAPGGYPQGPIVPMRLEPDVVLADWWARRDEPWIQLCTAGPSGFDRYARLFHAPADTAEDDVPSFEGILPAGLLRRLLVVLARHTQSPDDCFFALWDGYGDLPAALASQPRVRIPNRDYLLFRGRLEEARAWPSTGDGSGPFAGTSPNLVWPHDRSWFVATDIDQPWTAIGGTAALIDDVLADPALDAEPFVPSGHPTYWRKPQ
jgi:hypothetical protein